MLNQLISDKNKNHKKRTRVEDTCDTLINGFDKEISSYKKQYLPYSKTNTLEKPQILSKTQKIINEIKSKKIKSSVYMSTHDIKSSKRIQNLFKKDKFKKPQIIQKIPENQIQNSHSLWQAPNVAKIEEINKKKEYDPFDFNLSAEPFKKFKK